MIPITISIEELFQQTDYLIEINKAYSREGKGPFFSPEILEKIISLKQHSNEHLRSISDEQRDRITKAIKARQYVYPYLLKDIFEQVYGMLLAISEKDLLLLYEKERITIAIDSNLIMDPIAWDFFVSIIVLDCGHAMEQSHLKALKPKCCLCTQPVTSSHMVRDDAPFLLLKRLFQEATFSLLIAHSSAIDKRQNVSAYVLNLLHQQYNEKNLLCYRIDECFLNEISWETLIHINSEELMTGVYNKSILSLLTDIASKTDADTHSIELLMLVVRRLVRIEPGLLERNKTSLGLFYSVAIRFISGIQLLMELQPYLPKNYTEVLNNKMQEASHYNLSILFFLCLDPRGLKLLVKNPYWLESISEKTLNEVMPAGAYQHYSPAMILLSTDYGLAFLLENHSVTDKISRETLFSWIPDTAPVGALMPFAGYPMFYYLYSTATSLQLLNSSASLQGKLNVQACVSEVFDSLSNQDASAVTQTSESILDYIMTFYFSTQEPSLREKAIKAWGHIMMDAVYQKKNIVSFLCETQMGTTFFLLQYHHGGLHLITEALAAPAPLDPTHATGTQFAGDSLLGFLCSTEDNVRELMRNEGFLIPYISTRAFNNLPVDNEPTYSPAVALLLKPLGRSFLSNNITLISQIFAQALSSPIPSGLYQEAGVNDFAMCSVWSYLCYRLPSLQWLAEHPTLLDTLEPFSLNSIVFHEALAIDVGVLLFLCQRVVGIQLLAQNKTLWEKVTPESLNYLDRQGEHCILYALFRRIEGLQFLDSSPSFVAKIFVSSLNTIRQGDYAGESLLLILSQTELGLKILQQHSFWLKQVSMKVLNTIVRGQESYAEHQSVLFNLCKTTVGIDLLGGSHVFKKIDIDTLCYTMPLGSQDAEQSALFWLSKTDNGIQLLIDHPAVWAQVTPASVYTVISDGECKGQSVIGHLRAHGKATILLETLPQNTTTTALTAKFNTYSLAETSTFFRPEGPAMPLETTQDFSAQLDPAKFISESESSLTQ